MSGDSLDVPIPCPACDYDLRGQTVPHCPECGRTFDSLDDLVAASQAARRVFLRVLRWRQRIALSIGVSILGMCIVVGLLLGAMRFRGAGIAAPAEVLVAVMFLPMLLGSGAAIVCLVQVVRWRWDRRIPAEQRRELTGSLPLLLVFSVPFLVLLLLVFGSLL